MGNKLTQSIQFSIPVTPPSENETSIFRNSRTMFTGPKAINNFNYHTVWEALTASKEKGYSSKNFLGYRKKLNKGNYEKKYTWETYKTFIDKSEHFGRGLNLLGLCPEISVEDDDTFRFLGIYSKNKYDWFLGYFGAMCDSIVTVTLYDTLGIQAMEFILNQTKLTTILIEAISLKNILALIKQGKINEVKNLIVIEKEDDLESCEELEKLGYNVYSVDDVVLTGRTKSDYALRNPIDTDPCIIFYTSGTTGVPKGVVLTHKSILCNTDFVDLTGLEISHNEIYLSYLPLAHAMENVFFTLMLCRGMSVGVYSGDPRRITEDAQLLNPTMTIGVPRVLQRIHSGIVEKVKKLPALVNKLFYKGIDVKIKDFRNYGLVTNIFWDNIVFRTTKNLLGNNLKCIFIGSAPMNPDMLDFLRCSLCCNIGQGYGQTENCVIATTSHFFEPNSHHVGGPSLGLEIKLVSVPELGYFTSDIDAETGNNHPRGEIWTRGTMSFDRYLAEKEKTATTKNEEGWVKSGDIAEMLPENGNAFKIIDRVKNIFKLSQGEYVAPEKLETFLSNDKYVEQIFVTGNSFENYLVAVIYPNKKNIVEFLKKKGHKVEQDNIKEYLDNKELKEEIIQSMEKVGKENDFKGFEIVRKIKLVDFPFSVENDLLSPTQKLKRHVANKRFKNDIDELYKN